MLMSVSTFDTKKAVMTITTEIVQTASMIGQELKIAVKALMYMGPPVGRDDTSLLSKNNPT